MLDDEEKETGGASQMLNWVTTESSINPHAALNAIYNKPALKTKKLLPMSVRVYNGNMHYVQHKNDAQKRQDYHKKAQSRNSCWEPWAARRLSRFLNGYSQK